ncbi:hypothetical protein [Sphingobacterium siyangense]|uniref:hypothetical protein n=1 Tax=Sphingobacterium siyangense TaxID=459529 RepID=UPI002FDDAD19
MKFAITQEVDNRAYNKSFLVQDLSNSIQNHVQNINYGQDVETFYIGFVAVKTKIGYEHFFKERKPRYVDYKVTKDRLTGLPLETIKQYSYDIKFDNELYDEFVNSSDEESKKILAREILVSFKHLDKLPKKIRDFDKEKLKADVEQFFKKQDLI